MRKRETRIHLAHTDQTSSLQACLVLSMMRGHRRRHGLQTLTNGIRNPQPYWDGLGGPWLSLDVQRIGLRKDMGHSTLGSVSLGFFSKLG